MSTDAAPPLRHADLPADLRAVLPVILDLIVPASPDGRLPSAATVDVPAFIDEREPSTWAAVARDLTRLDALARSTHGSGAQTLSVAQTGALVAGERTARPAFLSELALATVTCYYQQPAVLRAMNLEPRPPFPLGFTVRAGDLGLLEPVRGRDKRYRPA